MGKYTNELKGVTERANRLLQGYKMEVIHQNNATCIYLQNTTTRSYIPLEAGLTDKTAISHIHMFIKGIEYTQG